MLIQAFAGARWWQVFRSIVLSFIGATCVVMAAHRGTPARRPNYDQDRQHRS